MTIVKCRVHPCKFNENGGCTKDLIQIWNYGGCKHLFYENSVHGSNKLYNYFKDRDKELEKVK